MNISLNRKAINMIKNQWYAIIPSKEIPTAKLVAVKRLGLDLCLFRTESGEIACVIDKCTHRGASLSKGTQKGDCVVRPFHGLHFNKQGKCTLIPAKGKSAGLEKRFNLESYSVLEANNMVYIWYGEKHNATQTLPFFDESIDKSYVYSEMSDLWNAHYSRCIENQLDVLHLPFVHHNTIGKGNKTIVNGPALEVIDGVITLTANNSLDNGQSPMPASECEINPKMNLQFKFPNVWQNYITKNIKVIIFFAPVDDENTMFYIRFYTNMFKIKTLNKLIAQLGKVMNKVIERQDRQYVITQQPKASALSCGENLLSGDSPIILYRKMRDELQKQASLDDNE